MNGQVMSPLECPSFEQLQAYAAAALPTPEMDVVQQHLHACSTCLCTLDRCDEESDTIVQVLSTLSSTADDEPAFAQLREALLSQSEAIVVGDLPTLAFDRAEPETRFPQQVGDYELIEPLGRGASGAVFRARHTKLDRLVAIKLLSTPHAGCDHLLLDRFHQEMRAIGKLEHAHIVRATDAGEVEGFHYLVMEYVEGVDVSQLLGFNGPLRVADACEIVRQAATGLQHAHEHGYVHRDVKPSNLFFTYDGQIKLLDLGLAGALKGPADPKDKGGLPFGTADYMSPEQWQNFDQVGVPADVYSLGCTLYKLLSGKPVFPASRRDYAAKMAAHLKSPIPTIRDVRPEVPLGLQRLIQTMLAKEPRQRPGSMQEIAMRLETYAHDARLASLGHRISGMPRELLNQLNAERETDSARSDSTSRRRAFVAVAIITLGTGLALPQFVSPRLTQATLATEVWRTLTTTADPRHFGKIDLDQVPQVEASRRSIRVTNANRTLIEMGSPVQGRFALRTTVELRTEDTTCGLFFRYRPGKYKDAVDHPFVTLEISRESNDQYILRWGHCRYSEEDEPIQFTEEYKLWADVDVSKRVTSAAPDRSQVSLEIRVGNVGFPAIYVNNQHITSQQWQQRWQAENMSMLSQREASQTYRGRLGVFVRSGSASFKETQLSYLD